ncbi:MAG: FadR family transcriptional regulator [Oscillospiraceae bacterium]|nr:FadR family transcriptional regulator [Oscillospiraceae bacterium]
MTNGLFFKESPTLRSILKYISEKDLSAGDKLPTEREMMKIVGVGRNSLREALKSLEAIGVVEIRQGSGIYLLKDGLEPGEHSVLWLSVHKTEIFNMITVREALDLRAIDLIPESQYEEIRRQLKDCVAEAGRTDLTNEKMLQHDLLFHNIIRQAAGNELLTNICVALTGGIYDERKVLFNQPERVKQSLREHLEIANAFGSGDIHQVKQAYAAHLASTRTAIELTS